MLIPRVDKRIRVLNFKSQCSHLVHQIKQDLLLLQHACDELKGSGKFVKLLEAVLVIGNYLNGDSSRGDAKGFKLDALLKLMDVKGSNRQTTLLHFVMAELIKVDEQILYLPDELKGIKPASTLKLESIMASIEDLDRGLELTKQEIEFARTDLSNVSAFKSRFLDSMLPFYEDCSVHVVELKELLNVTLDKLRDVTEYFGENGDEKPLRQLELFRTMHQFLNMFDHVSKEIQEGRTQFKIEQRNGRAVSPCKVKECDDNNKAMDLSACKVKEPDDNRARVGVSENAVESLPVFICELKNDNDKENQQPISSLEEKKTILEATTKAVLAQLPAKANVQSAPQCLGYDSDWSTG